MFERWTVDAIAGEVERQLQVAELSPKLLRRFYKQGKRHGRRTTIAEPSQTLIVNAVDIATSKIAQDFVEEARALRGQLAEATAKLDAPLDELPAPTPSDEGTAPSSQPSTRGPDLSGSLAGLRGRRSSAEQAARQAEHRARKDALTGVAQQRAVLEQQLRDLPSRYRQAVESCHETGELLWSRYRSGYADGASRRGPVESGTAPSQDIRFDDPPVFAELAELASPASPPTKEPS